MPIRPEFNVHALNEQGLHRAELIAEVYSDALTNIELLVPAGPERDQALIKLQESAFYAKRGMAKEPTNQC